MNAVQAEIFFTLKNELEEAGHGERGQIIDRASEFLSMSKATVYRRLDKVGWDSGRKTRSDRGEICVDKELALKAAGMLRTATRATGKQTLPLTTVREILKENGLGIENEKGEIIMPHATTISRAMERYGCHPEQVKKGSPSQSMRSLHPNHVWQLDASVCVIFYLPKGKVEVMDEAKYYKNKPENLKKAERARVIRWAITDHYSSAIFCRYTLGAEDSVSAISVLIEAMCARNDDDIFHGAPLILYSDKGTAFTSRMMQSFLKRLGIQHITHEPGNPRATGQVEQAHNIIETQFEGRLRFMAIADLETLNARLNDWLIAWNANQVHSRHKRTRNQMWLTITAEQLRVPESVEALKALVASPAVDRQVPGSLILDYTIKGLEQKRYNLRHIPGIYIGQKIGISVNPYEAPALDVIITAPDGEESIYTIKPFDTDRAGFDLSAPVIGQEFKAPADTATDKAIKSMDKNAYNATSLEEAKKARAKNTPAYQDIDIMADVSASRKPTYFKKSGTDLAVDGREREEAPMSLVQSARILKPLVENAGLEWGAEKMQYLSENYKDGVKERELDSIVEFFLSQEMGEEREFLKVVGGGHEYSE